uniref:Uncharacterized protein n=1 Tax=Hyaloperonospora arabidopsidis (strain Emoy2) TaxID=559515 RepID=M4B2E7_HYAAE
MALICVHHEEKALRRCSVKDIRSVASTRFLLRATSEKVLHLFKIRRSAGLHHCMAFLERRKSNKVFSHKLWLWRMVICLGR